jgi:hypothetical protein
VCCDRSNPHAVLAPLADLADYSWLVGEEAAGWLARLVDDPRSPLQQLTALRRELSTERARLVVDQLDLRRRAVDKFGDRAAAMFFTRVQLEQATDLWIARYKAERFAAATPGATIGDYCCGIGGDLAAFAERGPAIGVDASEIACLLADANLRGAATIRCGDVTTLTPARDGSWHLDPDRRAGGGRTTDVRGYAPGPELIDRWRIAAPNGAVKLAPAAEALPSWAALAELEWISRDRECRQQVAWFGGLATPPGRRRATAVDRDGGHVTLVGDARVPLDSVDEPRSYLFDPDPALLAADLLGALAAQHGLASLGPGSAYLTGDSAGPVPLAASFEVKDCLPLRVPELAAYLAQRRVGQLEAKKRGVDLNLETLRRQLKLHGDESATLILTRIGPQEVAIVTARVASDTN